jgi:hypothetical protein
VATVNIVGTSLCFIGEDPGDRIWKSRRAPVDQKNLHSQGYDRFGVVLGNIIAYSLCALQLRYRILSLPSEIYYMDTVPMVIQPLNFLLVTVVALGLCFLTTLLPSRAASALDPVTALRFG